MDLIIHNNFGSQSSTSDSFANILYKTISYVSDVKKVSKKNYNLATSTSKSLVVENSGKFTLGGKNKALIKSGDINELTIKKADGYLKTTGFDMLHVKNASIAIHDFLMCGSSYKTARSLTRQFLKGDDSITGSHADDYLSGYRGKDIITGGLGADVMFGGHGKDHFVYNSISDSGSVTTTTINGFLHAGGNTYTQSDFNDLILDFQSGKDKIDLRKIGLKSKKSLSIVSKTYDTTENSPNSSYDLWVDQDRDGYPDMVIGFVDTHHKLKLSDVLI